MKQLLTKKNILAALGTVAVIVVGAVVAKTRKDLSGINIENKDGFDEGESLDVAEEPVVPTKPVRNRKDAS